MLIICCSSCFSSIFFLFFLSSFFFDNCGKILPVHSAVCLLWTYRREGRSRIFVDFCSHTLQKLPTSRMKCPILPPIKRPSQPFPMNVRSLRVQKKGVYLVFCRFGKLGPYHPDHELEHAWFVAYKRRLLWMTTLLKKLPRIPNPLRLDSWHVAPMRL